MNLKSWCIDNIYFESAMSTEGYPKLGTEKVESLG